MVMTDDMPLPEVRVEAGLSPAACREAWDDLTKPLFAVSLLTGPEHFAAEWAFHRLDRLVVSQVEFTPQEFLHEPHRHDLADNDLLLLELYEAGSGRGVSAGVPTFIDPGRVHLVDLSRSYRTVTTAVRTKGVVIPHAAVQYDPRRHPPYLVLPVDTPRGAMLVTALRGLVAQLPSVTMQDAPALADAFAALVRALLLTPTAPLDEADARAVTKARIRHHIDQHLAADLGVEELARRFALSRATLYRLFQTEGGIEAYIRDRRLDRCSDALMLVAPGRGRVREISERLGFADAGHFTRAFRQRFGVAPSDHLGIRLRPPARSVELPPSSGSHDSVRLFGDWLRRETARSASEPG